MPTHAERQIVPYTAEQMFDLVADVGRYPEFLPWCVAARVRHATATELVADLTIGFGPFRESFTSRVALTRPSSARVSYERGPFRYLNNQWGFTPHALPVRAGAEAARTDGAGGEAHTVGCLVQFFVDFEFRSRILQAAIGVVFNEAVRRMVNAFLKRAAEVYGRSPAPAPATGVPAT